MGIHTSPVWATIWCDAHTCEATISWTALVSCARDTDSYALASTAAAKAGWSAYRSRSLRHYCPKHSPRPGHRMERLTTGPWAPTTSDTGA